jgi:hypothetical protein
MTRVVRTVCAHDCPDMCAELHPDEVARRGLAGGGATYQSTWLDVRSAV